MTDPSIFACAGLDLAVPTNVPPDYRDPAVVKKAGYSYLAPQGCDGTLQKDVVDGHAFEDTQFAARAAGLKVIPWAKLYGGDEKQIAAEAAASVDFIDRHRPDGWQLNPETEYKDDGRWRNAVYVDALLNGLNSKGIDPASLVWAITPLGGASIPPGQEVSPWAFSYDLTPWLKLPQVWCLPEAYWAAGVDGAALEYRPLNVADQWLAKQHWPVERFGFTLGWWNASFPSAAQYFADLDVVRARYGWKQGFAVYTADQMPGDVIAAFGMGTAKGYAASGEASPAPTPPPVAVQPVDANKAIVKDADGWLTQQADPKPLSRLRIARRIAANGSTGLAADDKKWNAARDAIKQALDNAGIA